MKQNIDNVFKEFKRDPEGKLMSEMGAMTDLALRLKNAKREGPVLGSGSIPCYRRIPYGNGYALVGDSGTAMDFWSGQGIDQASTRATYLAEELGEYLGYILELDENKVKKILGVFSDYAKEANVG